MDQVIQINRPKDEGDILFLEEMLKKRNENL